MISKDIRRLLFILSVLIPYTSAFADDPGITKVRLIQESDTSYVFELDISAKYLWTIAPPILPEGFSISDPQYRDQSGWITVKALITSSGPAFTPADEMILPWQRAGADITVQWMDGNTYKGLYNRTLEGIHIPMSELMPVTKSTGEVLGGSFMTGLKHLPFRIIHPLLVFVLVLAFPSRRVFYYLFLMTLGQMSALVLSELGLKGTDMLFSEILLILLIFLLAISTVYKIRFRFLGHILVLAGALHALSVPGELPIPDLDSLQRTQALFAFILALDLGHYLLALLFLGLNMAFEKYLLQAKWPSVIAGSLAVFLLILVFSKHVVSGNNQVLAQDNKTVSFTYKSYAPQSNLTARQPQRGKGMMTTPVMVYLSIEAHELRQEILVQVSEILPYMDQGDLSNGIIPVESQEQLKKDLQDSLSLANTLYVNNSLLQPVDKITSFVTLGRGGVTTRETPGEENLDEAILGITFIYELGSLPDSLVLDWNFYPGSIPFIEASAVDPHGAFTTMLSPQASMLRWNNRLAGFRVPAISAITREIQLRPMVSLLLWVFLLFMGARMVILKKKLKARSWMMAILVISFITYPFLRIKVDLPFLPEGKPSAEIAGKILNDLLSNTYRAFDRRNESDVYDLLAISVSGDQLTQIYIQNRQAMALENRGGARAKVDEVNIRELRDLKRLEEQIYLADTRWTVRGSVNHFGHTHYRKNQYRALVSFGIDGDSWKIHNIEILDTRRLF
jgi:hypothetical protein